MDVRTKIGNGARKVSSKRGAVGLWKGRREDGDPYVILKNRNNRKRGGTLQGKQKVKGKGGFQKMTKKRGLW